MYRLECCVSSLKLPWLKFETQRAWVLNQKCIPAFWGEAHIPQGKRLFGGFSVDSSDFFGLLFPHIAQVCLCGGKKCVQLIWLTAQLSSLHISLQTNRTHPTLSWSQKLARSKHTTDITASKTLFVYTRCY